MIHQTKAQMRADLDKLIRKARYGKAKLRVTRCPAGDCHGNTYLTRKFGGVMPGHLNPVTLGEG